MPALDAIAALRDAAAVSAGRESAPHAGAAGGLAAIPRRMAQGLSPAYFAMVMATGIVSIATHQLGMTAVADAFFRLNVAVYAAIWLLTTLRAVWFPRELWRDMIDHQRGPAFFTSVAR